MQSISVADRRAKTHRQIELVDTALTEEFSMLAAGVVHREVARVSEGLLANAHFTDHVAVLTGRIASEHLRAAVAPMTHSPLRTTETQRSVAKSHWWTRR
jgi:hypothetical protein